MVDNNRTDRAAVSLSSFQIETRLRQAFRSQDTSDYGVDAQVEIMRGDVATGRLVGLQIKGGPSYFAEKTPDGWKYRPSKRHISYWLGHSLPMFLLLVDLAAETIYWQEVSNAPWKPGPRAARSSSSLEFRPWTRQGRPGRPQPIGSPTPQVISTTTTSTECPPMSLRS